MLCLENTTELEVAASSRPPPPAAALDDEDTPASASSTSVKGTSLKLSKADRKCAASSDPTLVVDRGPKRICLNRAEFDFVDQIRSAEVKHVRLMGEAFISVANKLTDSGYIQLDSDDELEFADPKLTGTVPDEF
ncbi:uncharacterized protein ColSpa_12619 [Colletotrichum spaethianum]|uniref:Uncharacterized protein n=1 Tax=Colletotrichum spaethianum TaxID=700344 RepID=A0AA37PHT4_9PEZI|nr:uncharacterized protein ColSpa_12619 [Colletotrichum spaethianum]GKT52438.1 hypothetical protein ColSpa_12619 [Colletotrichum spaethianum]